MVVWPKPCKSRSSLGIYPKPRSRKDRGFSLRAQYTGAARGNTRWKAPRRFMRRFRCRRRALPGADPRVEQGTVPCLRLVDEQGNEIPEGVREKAGFFQFGSHSRPNPPASIDRQVGVIAGGGNGKRKVPGPKAPDLVG